MKALHFRLRVNEETIGMFVAQRREREIPPDGWCTYDVRVTGDGLKVDEVEMVIHHRYGDGAWVLIRKALEQMEQPQMVSTPGRPWGP